MAQAAWAAWRCDGPGTLAAPATSCRGCAEWARGTDATLVQSPKHGRTGVMGRGEALGPVMPDVRMRPLLTPGAWQCRAGIQ